MSISRDSPPSSQIGKQAWGGQGPPKSHSSMGPGILVQGKGRNPRGLGSHSGQGWEEAETSEWLPALCPHVVMGPGGSGSWGKSGDCNASPRPTLEPPN